MLVVDGSIETDVAVRFRRHHARGRGPRGPHPHGRHGHSEGADLRGEWNPHHPCPSLQGQTTKKCSEQHTRAGRKLLESIYGKDWIKRLVADERTRGIPQTVVEWSEG